MIETILSTTYFKEEEKMWLYITRMIIMCGIYLNQGQFMSQNLSQFPFTDMYAPFGRTQ